MRRLLLPLAILVLAALWLFREQIERAWEERSRREEHKRAVAERVRTFGPAARARLRPDFARASVPYPPAQLTLIGLKDERQLEVHAAGRDGRFRFIRRYPVLAASGGPGPKLREGDRQVPEGLYAIESLNPRSRFHLSLRVNYPNAADRALAAAEGRTNLGGDIMIHGGAVSAGCLAVGDPAAEDLFVLAAETGLANIRVILAPVDLRRRPAPPLPPDAPPWTTKLHAEIGRALEGWDPPDP